MPLHPQVKIIVEEAAALGLPDYQDLSPVEARKQMLELTPPVDPLLAAERVENLNTDAIQADPDRLAVGGDSAGGHLAAVVALMARDRKGPRIELQVLIYPITDCNFSTPSYLENKDGYMLTRDLMKWFWNHFLEDEGLAKDPYVSPLRAKNFSDLPQTLIITAEYDPLRDEGEAYGQRLQEAGVNVTLLRYPGMIHGFIHMPARLDKAKEALDEIAGRLRGILRIQKIET